MSKYMTGENFYSALKENYPKIYEYMLCLNHNSHDVVMIFACLHEVVGMTYNDMDSVEYEDGSYGLDYFPLYCAIDLNHKALETALEVKLL